MKQKRKKKVDFSLYTNQLYCLLNVPFLEIIIIISSSSSSSINDHYQYFAAASIDSVTLTPCVQNRIQVGGFGTVIVNNRHHVGKVITPLLVPS